MLKPLHPFSHAKYNSIDKYIPLFNCLAAAWADSLLGGLGSSDVGGWGPTGTS